MKLIKENITDYLKPKSFTEINNEINKIIDEFIDEISIKDFNNSFNIFKKIYPEIKKIKQNNTFSYIISKKVLLDIIDDIILSTSHFNENSKTVYYNFPNIAEFWVHLVTNPNIQDQYKVVMDKLVDKISYKFNIEFF